MITFDGNNQTCIEQNKKGYMEHSNISERRSFPHAATQLETERNTRGKDQLKTDVKEV